MTEIGLSGDQLLQGGVYVQCQAQRGSGLQQNHKIIFQVMQRFHGADGVLHDRQCGRLVCRQICRAGEGHRRAPLASHFDNFGIVR